MGEGVLGELKVNEGMSERARLRHSMYAHPHRHTHTHTHMRHGGGYFSGFASVREKVEREKW